MPGLTPRLRIPLATRLMLGKRLGSRYPSFTTVTGCVVPLGANRASNSASGSTHSPVFRPWASYQLLLPKMTFVMRIPRTADCCTSLARRRYSAVVPSHALSQAVRSGRIIVANLRVHFHSNNTISAVTSIQRKRIDFTFCLPESERNGPGHSPCPICRPIVRQEYIPEQRAVGRQRQPSQIAMAPFPCVTRDIRLL